MITSLGEEGAGLCASHTFVLHVLVFVLFLFLLVSWILRNSPVSMSGFSIGSIFHQASSSISSVHFESGFGFFLFESGCGFHHSSPDTVLIDLESGPGSGFH